MMGVSVREKPKGSGIWWVFINHKGKRRSKRVGSEKAARAAAEKIEARLTLGEFNMDVEKPGETFKECAERWLALPHEWKETTKESYQSNLKRYAYPAFGKRYIKDIQRKDLKAFFDDLLTRGFSSSTVSVLRAAVNGAFSEAVDSEEIAHNPLLDLKMRLKRRRSISITPLTETEAEKLLNQAKVFMGGFHYPALLCALRTGIRIGELQALQWEDVSFNERLLEVKRSCRKNRITDTKNRQKRRVDMTPHLVEALRKLRTDQKSRALKKGHAVPEWVFASRRGGMLCRSSFENALRRCLKDAGLRKIRPHDLRHSYATIRLLRGHNVGDVSYQLGHSSIQITYDIYGHWIPGRFKSEVDELDAPLQSNAKGCK